MDSTIAEPLGPRDPRQIGSFPLIGRLGAGGMGEVYLATSEQGYVAVKRVRSPRVSRERFEREIEVLYRVPAGVAPRVLAHDSVTSLPWFATEYVAGLDLDDAVRLHGPLGPGALGFLLAEVAAALEPVHAAKIVHRDIKPANLMLVRDGLKLIDFGIARAVDLPRLTRQGASYGTRGYCAPEQGDGDEAVAAPADVYALGAVLLFAATGSEPGDVPDLAPLRTLDADLAAVVESCLAVLPGARPTAAQLLAWARASGAGGEESWPAAVSRRIEARRAFAATSVHRIETVDPDTAPEPEPEWAPEAEWAPKPQWSPEPEPAHRRPPPRPAAVDRSRGRSGRGESGLRDAAQLLADQVRRQWEREERVRRVHDPYPLPIRFQGARSGLFDHWALIRRTGRGTHPGPLPLAGELDEIAARFRSIPSQRLVILGPAGSGKTILALRFVLDLLDAQRPGERVPVIFSLGSWDPTELSLSGWMGRQLARDYNALEAPAAGGGNTAAALIEDHRILPVLDGFDEIAAGLQGPALIALNEYGGPLLLTSRPAEYETAVRDHDVLTAAACIALTALDGADVAEYLTLASRPGPESAPGSGWAPVLRRLREQPASDGVAHLANALTTPLMVTLARAVYSDAPGRDPAELLDTDRFRTTEDVQKHLLTEFVPARYRRTDAGRRSWNAERAEHWLGYLAWHMEQQGRHDLAWWELGTVVGRRALMLVVGVVVAVATGIVAALVYGTAAALDSGPASGLRTALLAGITNGLGVGLTFGLMHGFASNLKVGGPVFEPSRMRIQLRGGMRRRLREGFVPRVFGGLWACWCAAYAAAFPHASTLAIAVQVRDALALGTGLGLAIGLVAAIGAGLEAVSERAKAARPSVLLTTNRINVLTQLAVVSAVIGVGYGAVLGPAPGVAAGLMVALGLGTMTAWGRWVVLARLWLPLHGRVPWAVLAFLEDAYQRGVLRQAGAVYQFRHDRIQTRLAEQFVPAPGAAVREEEQM